MRGKLVTIFGGSGFLGSYLVPKLRSRGAMVRVVVRDIDQAIPLKTSGPVGQVDLVVANLKHDNEIERVIGDSDYVVNLMGILNENRKHRFTAVHLDLPKKIATVAAHRNVKRLVHISAIGADRDSKSKYASSKGLGEVEVLKAFSQATILRPSIMFGPEDKFFNKFAEMASHSPFLPIIGGGKTKMQPVYVGDVAEVIVRVLVDQVGGQNPHAGKIYELGGPELYTFRELMEYLLKVIQRRRLLLSIPYPIASMMGAVMGLFPNPVLTRDQVKLAKVDNVVSDGAHGFKEFNIEPTALEAVLPGYLQRYRFHG